MSGDEDRTIDGRVVVAMWPARNTGDIVYILDDARLFLACGPRECGTTGHEHCEVLLMGG